MRLNPFALWKRYREERKLRKLFGKKPKPEDIERNNAKIKAFRDIGSAYPPLKMLVELLGDPKRKLINTKAAPELIKSLKDKPEGELKQMQREVDLMLNLSQSSAKLAHLTEKINLIEQGVTHRYDPGKERGFSSNSNRTGIARMLFGTSSSIKKINKKEIEDTKKEYGQAVADFEGLGKEIIKKFEFSNEEKAKLEEEVRSGLSPGYVTFKKLYSKYRDYIDAMPVSIGAWK